MKKTGAWLVRYALEQIGVRYTFGIPGVHNTEIYDELNNSKSITPILVTHEAGAAFMADAISRTTDHIGTIVTVPAAGTTHAASGIGEAYLDGIPMLCISGGIRRDLEFGYQLHELDQQKLVKPITKANFVIEKHQDIIPTIYEAYNIANQGEPGPVFVEVPVNIQLFTGDIDALPTYSKPEVKDNINAAAIRDAAQLLIDSKQVGIFVGWGARHASDTILKIAEHLQAPIATTLQGLATVPSNHPLHTGMGYGPASVPASENAFKKVDTVLAIGTRFGEIATGSFGIPAPEKLIHIDINPNVFDRNYKATICVESDAAIAATMLLEAINSLQSTAKSHPSEIASQIARDKEKYLNEWLSHDSKGRVNPACFFTELREILNDDDFVLADDGNHTFLTAELMPIHKAGHFVSPTDFNCMGYCTPATIACKLANPDKNVVGIVGDGAFVMTCMELATAAANQIGAIIFVFNDGELSQISQAQEKPYNRKTCSILSSVKFDGVAHATGCKYIKLDNNEDVKTGLTEALEASQNGQPVIVDVFVDYSKPTRFTQGAVATNLKRFPLGMKTRIIGRTIKRKITG